VHQSFNRRTGTKVRNGRVLRKNNHVPTAALGYVLHRESPGRGFRHVVTKRDLQAFIDIIPDWQKLSARLERIVLATPEEGYDGLYAFHQRDETGTIFLCAWPKDFWYELGPCYFDSHEEIFKILGVSYDRSEKGAFCRFTDAQARAFMLLHVFLHELAHHYDEVNQKHHGASKGKDWVRRFATGRFRHLYPEYVCVFGDPAKSA